MKCEVSSQSRVIWSCNKETEIPLLQCSAIIHESGWWISRLIPCSWNKNVFEIIVSAEKQLQYYLLTVHSVVLEVGGVRERVGANYCSQIVFWVDLFVFICLLCLFYEFFKTSNSNDFWSHPSFEVRFAALFSVKLDHWSYVQLNLWCLKNSSLPPLGPPLPRKGNLRPLTTQSSVRRRLCVPNSVFFRT